MVKYLIILLQSEYISLCFHERRRWHTLFYQLKKPSNIPGRPDWLGELFFNWEGRAPHCEQLEEYLSMLVISGCLHYSSPDFKQYWAPKEIVLLWIKEFTHLEKGEKRYLEDVVFDLAREEFSKAEAA